MLALRRPVIFIFVATACSSAGLPEPPELLAMEPSQGDVGSDTAVAILGRGFYPEVRVSFAGSGSRVDATFVLTLIASDTSVALTDVTHTDSERLSATVPGSVPPGIFDLELEDPYGRTALLSDAFEADCPQGSEAMTFFHDQDGDGYTSLSDTQTSCADPDGAGTEWVDSPTLGDCDDSDSGIYHGTICDDAVACTEHDLCNDGVCRGAGTAACGTCDDSCGCGTASCCLDACSGTSCSACQSGCACNTTCTTAQGCSLNCASGALCVAHATGSGDATMGCNNATCALDCADMPGNCVLDCNGTSICDLTCDAANDCTTQCSDDSVCIMSCASLTGLCTMLCTSPQSCPGDVIVCNRPCP